MSEIGKPNWLFVPGAWMGRWIWDDLIAEMQSDDLSIHAITLTGLDSGDKHSNVHLETHVADVIEYIDAHGLTDVVLVGHSYSGIVVGQVADRIPEKIARLVFIEAILPAGGQSMLESGGNDVEEELKIIKENSGLWPPPTADELSGVAGLSAEQRDYLVESFVPHPGKTVSEPAKIESTTIDIPVTFVGANFPETLKNGTLFTETKHVELDGGHWPLLTKTEALAAILLEVS